MSQLEAPARPVDTAAPQSGSRKRIAIFIEHDIVYRYFLRNRAFAGGSSSCRAACAHVVTPFDRSFADRIIDFVEQRVADRSEVAGR
jgi:hypothetical protein